MRRSLLVVASAVLMLVAFGQRVIAQDVKTLEIGAQAPDFKLIGIDDQQHELKDYASSKVLVVVFTTNHCPTSQAYEPRLIKLFHDYKDKGVSLVVINPSNNQGLRLDEFGYTDLSDSFEDMKIRAKDKNFPFNYLYDGETQKVAKAYGAQATPHAFVFNEKRELQFVGGIDDSDVKEVKHHYVRDAIDAILAGKPVAVQKSRVFGCSTKWIEKAPSAQAYLEKEKAKPVSLKDLDEAQLKELVKNDTNDVLLISVWATWCGPCVAELPEFVEMSRWYQTRPFKLVTISIDETDDRENALKILKKNFVASDNYFSTFEDKDRLADLLDKKWEGPIPYTVLIAPGGEVLYRKSGAIDPLELKREIVKNIGSTYANRRQ